ncbi:hypothetical protein HIM_00563 [Hirsutella minnesotensis 3608]|nr:hypothetical protein HIM_00563 [Hirsutella minnesotensis 3608]
MSSSKTWPVPHLWRNDEEMAKKDDDHRLLRHHKRPSVGQWHVARPPRRAWVLRIVVYSLFAAAIILFFFRTTKADKGLGSSSPKGRYIPSMTRQKDPPKQDPRIHAPRPDADHDTKQAKPPQKLVDNAGSGEAPHDPDLHKNYNGPIQLLALINTIRAVPPLGPSTKRSHILFAAASLSSAATLLPMACKMAQTPDNVVHFTLMGRDDIPIPDLLKINGIDPSCPVTVHDARPDHGTTSTNKRMFTSVERALGIMNRILRPKVILVDSTNAETTYFQSAARSHAKMSRTALIELPEKPESRLAWMTKLDGPALSAWNQVRFDILIHSPPTGTGNLKRLLQSLARADLGGHAIPHLVIELPSTVDAPLEKYLAGYKWPPPRLAQKEMPSMLTLRRRIPRQTLTEEESSARFLESFWPSDPAHSHALVLSPHMEISPQFFHYVKYAVLFQRHSGSAIKDGLKAKTMGISLSVPTTFLGGTHPFTPPRAVQEDESKPEGIPFLWQAPTSDAVVLFGEKWIELHGYVSRVLERHRSLSHSPAVLATKEVGKKYPAWMEYALQLARLRGYFTFYPSREVAKVIAGVHTDLPDKPEEFQKQVGTRDKEKEILADEASELFDVGVEAELLDILPGEGQQQASEGLPTLLWDGKRMSADEVQSQAAQFATEFRRDVGHCPESEEKRPRVPDRYAQDLFCEVHDKEE